MGLDICSFVDLIAKMACFERVCNSPRASLILHIPADLLQADERGSSLNTHILSSTSHSNHNLPKFQRLPLWEYLHPGAGFLDGVSDPVALYAAQTSLGSWLCCQFVVSQISGLISGGIDI